MSESRQSPEGGGHELSVSLELSFWRNNTAAQVRSILKQDARKIHVMSMLARQSPAGKYQTELGAVYRLKDDTRESAGGLLACIFHPMQEEIPDHYRIIHFELGDTPSFVPATQYGISDDGELLFIDEKIEVAFARKQDKEDPSKDMPMFVVVGVPDAPNELDGEPEARLMAMIESLASDENREEVMW